MLVPGASQVCLDAPWLGDKARLAHTPLVTS